MISLKLAAKQFEKFVADNSPTILAGVGVVGTVATAYFAGRGSFKAADLLVEEKARRVMHNEPDMDFKAKVKTTWIHFLPAAGTTALTIACIVCANRISMRRAAAMATAYSMSNKALEEYKEKVKAKLGVNKEKAVQDEIAQEKVTQSSDKQIVIIGTGDVMCYDIPSGRYFQSNMETLRRIMNDINQNVIHEGYATLEDLYRSLGLAPTPWSTEVGWNDDALLEIDFTTTLAKDGTPCVAINYETGPIREYKRLNR